MGLALSMSKEVSHLTDSLTNITDVSDPETYLAILNLYDAATDPKTLLDWLKDQSEPLGTVFIHQPLWSVEALKKFRDDAEGLVSHLIVTHQIYPESLNEESYFDECRAVLADTEKWLFFKQKTPSTSSKTG